MQDIDVLFYPCPRNGPTWRPKASRLCVLQFWGISAALAKS